MGEADDDEDEESGNLHCGDVWRCQNKRTYLPRCMELTDGWDNIFENLYFPKI